MRAAIYARYSSDKQQESSIGDQFAICLARAEREGWQADIRHADQAISGSTAVASRPGGAALLADALAGRFQVLLLEGLDRLSRDQVEQESIVRRLEHRGIRIVGLADGYDSQHAGRKVMRGVRGLINELYLDDLRHKTQRGMHGQFDRGFIAGGKCYGYRIVKEEAGSRYEIDEEQAHWVRWIFQQAAAGSTMRSIVYRLNEQGVPSPRGGAWAVSAIYGSPVKGSGLLNNTLYVGRYIWNRSQWLKDPDSGQRRRIERPRNEWRTQDLPELRIVDDLTWRKVRDRIDDGRDEFGRKREQRPMTTLLGGLLRCPHCGGAVIARSATTYGCGVSHDRGLTECPDFRISRKLAERRILSVIRDDLLSSAAAAEFEAAFSAHVHRRLGSDSRKGELDARAKALEGEIGRLIEAIAAVGISPSIKTRLQTAEREHATIVAQLGEMQKAGTALPDIAAIFKELLLNLETALKRDSAQARQALEGIFQRIDIELRGEEVWAQINTGPALQIAVGADAYNGGCGSPIAPLKIQIK